MYDVIIVGSGPAGATAAYRLGQAGCRVVVVEKQKLPRYKPCGGGLSLEFLEQQFPFSFSPAIDMHVHKVYYQFLGLEINLPVRDRAMAMVMRDRFDQHILAHASCEVRERTGVRQVWQEPDRVVVEADNGEKISARYLIGADGANSVVAHALGARRKRSIPAIEIEARVPDSIYRRYAGGPYFIFDGQPRYGYLWVFPKTSCLSVGIAGLHPKRGQLQAELQKVMAGLGIPLDHAIQHGHSIPLYNTAETVRSGRVLLAGDAAGAADPFSGEGIRPAILSGRLAAEAIATGQLERYPAVFHQQIGRNNMESWWAGQVFYRLQEICLLFGAGNPVTTEAILDMLSGRGSALRVLGKSVFSLPYYTLAELVAGAAGWIGGPQARARAKAAFFPGTYSG